MNPGHLQKLLAFDREAQTGFGGLAAGIDEAGRGPLAGPVVAAAVILPVSLPSEPLWDFLNDSKKVSPRKRQNLFREISRFCLTGVAAVGQKEIDEVNIYQATRLAMKQAVLNLSRTPDFLLIDGKMRLDLPIRQRAVVGGDAKSASIAAASIIAKVYRDSLMMSFDRIYPEYRFSKHKGYATREHLQKLREIGPSPIHRRSFAPVRLLDSQGCYEPVEN